METLSIADAAELKASIAVKQRSVQTIKQHEKHIALQAILKEISLLPDYTSLSCLHQESVNVLSQSESETEWTPIRLFYLLFKEENFKLISDHINAYTAIQQAQKPLSLHAWLWTDINDPEIKLFVAMTLYMSMVVCPSIEDYWWTDQFAAQHSTFISHISR